MSRRGRGGKRPWGDNANGWEERGGYMNAKKQKLAEQFTADTPRNVEIAGGVSSGSHMFEGVSIHVNGYTVPSSDELKRLMMLHGGMYYHYYSKTKVTHVIATRLPYAKIKELRDEKIVQPDWIMDSIKAGKLLSDIPYQLYTNRITSQGTLKFTKKDLPLTQYQGNTNASSAARQTLSDTDTDLQNNVDEVHGHDETQVPHPESRGEDELEESGSPSHNLNLKSAANVLPETLASNTMNYSVNPSPSKPVPVRSHPQSPRAGKGPAKAGDANFVSEFYSNSRLHYISTWGAEFKAYVNKLQSSGDTSFPGRERLRRLGENRRHAKSCSLESQEDESVKSTSGISDSVYDFQKIHGKKSKPHASVQQDRVIMHVDMDCFFVSVGLRNRPELIGKPVAVTHSRGKGMAEANQESREYEKAYYTNKYKQGGGKGLKSRHTDLAGVSPLEAGKSRGADSTACESILREPFNPEYADLLVSNNHSGNDSESLSTPGIRSQSTSLRPPDEHPAGQTGPGKVRSKSDFSSMAEIASCSYEARKVGLRNGMFMGEAKRLCPDLQMIPYDFEGYRRVSQTLYETVASYTHDIEAVSCDEMFIDVTGILEDTGVTPLDLARVLREEIKEKTRCNASAGIACNILLARMSTRKAKPNGQFYLDAKDALDFMKQQPVKDLPGVGWSTGSRLRTMGIETCGDLQGLSLSALQKDFGPKTGQALFSYCRGIDDRPIKVERERKSVSAEINYGIRFTQNSEADTFVSELAAEVHRRLTAIQMVGKTITLKLKVRREGAPKETSKFMGHGICDNLAKSTTLAQPTDRLEVIQQESKTLLSQMRIDAADLRGVGIQISKLAAANAAASPGATNNKSLLDFVKPLQKTTDEIVSKPTVRDPARSQASNDKKSSGTILSFISKQKSTASTQGKSTSSLQQVKITPLPPLPSFKPDTATPLRKLTSREEQEEFCLPSPSQLDPSVLAALPPNIRENIERTYKAQQQSKLKTAQNTSSVYPNMDKVKPDVGISKEKSILCHSNNLQSRHTETESTFLTHPSKIKRNVEMSTWDQPSTSNGTVHSREDLIPPGASSGAVYSNHGYDPNVLKELPPDILQEIMGQEVAASRERKEEQEQARLDLEEDEDALGPVEALPSFSQIDPSCLEALPSVLQKELQLAYQRQHKISGDIGNPARPTLKSSPFKLHRRRGRPKKNSPHKGAKQGSKLAGTVDILAMVTGVKNSPVQKSHSGFCEDSITNLDHPVEAMSSCCDAESEETAKIKPVNLCGAVALWDVKAMLKEWTTSVEEPGDEDIDHLVLYLNELIVDRNLEMTDHVLRGMKRLASQMESTSPWRDAYQIIVDRVQETVSQLYCSKLKLA